MLLIIEKTALTLPSECMAIGKFPHGENGYYFVSSTNQYFAASPIIIEFDSDEEEESLQDVLSIGNKLVYLPVQSVLDINKLTKGKQVFIRYGLQNVYDEEIVLESGGNTFSSKVEKQYPVTVLFPQDPLPRYSLQMNLTGLQVITQQLKSGAYYYVNPGRTMAYAPINETAFVGFPVHENIPMRWTTRPNSILSKFAKFESADTEERGDGEFCANEVISIVKMLISDGVIKPDLFHEMTRKYFDLDYVYTATETPEPSEEDIAYSPDIADDVATEPLLEHEELTDYMVTKTEPLLTPEEITDDVLADAARLGIDISFPTEGGVEDEEYDEEQELWDDEYETGWEDHDEEEEF